MNYTPDFQFSGNNSSESREADNQLSGGETFPETSALWGILEGSNITFSTSGDVITINSTTTGGNPLGINVSNYLTKSTSGDVVTINGAQIGTKADITLLDSYAGTNSTAITNLETEIVSQLGTKADEFSLIAGDNISIGTSTRNFTFEYTGPTGSGSPLGLLAGDFLTFSTVGDVVTIKGDQIGTKADEFSLIAGDNISIGTSGTDYTFSYTGPTSGGGSVVQTVTKLINTITTYSSPAVGFTNITDTEIAITPVYSNSKVILTCMLNGEIYQENKFIILKDGVLATNGTNINSVGSWSGYVAAPYDTDNASTPSNIYFQYFDTLASASIGTYSIGVSATDGGAHTFSLNRTLGNPGAVGHEFMVSSIMLQEIKM